MKFTTFEVLMAVLELLMFSTRPLVKLYISRTLHVLRQLKLAIIEVLGKIIRQTEKVEFFFP